MPVKQTATWIQHPPGSNIQVAGCLTGRTQQVYSDIAFKGKGQVLDTALLHDEHMLRNALQSRKWQLIGMS